MSENIDNAVRLLDDEIREYQLRIDRLHRVRNLLVEEWKVEVKQAMTEQRVPSEDNLSVVRELKENALQTEIQESLEGMVENGKVVVRIEGIEDKPHWYQMLAHLADGLKSETYLIRACFPDPETGKGSFAKSMAVLLDAHPPWAETTGDGVYRITEAGTYWLEHGRSVIMGEPEPKVRPPRTKVKLEPMWSRTKAVKLEPMWSRILKRLTIASCTQETLLSEFWPDTDPKFHPSVFSLATKRLRRSDHPYIRLRDDGFWELTNDGRVYLNLPPIEPSEEPPVAPEFVSVEVLSDETSEPVNTEEEIDRSEEAFAGGARMVYHFKLLWALMEEGPCHEAKLIALCFPSPSDGWSRAFHKLMSPMLKADLPLIKYDRKSGLYSVTPMGKIHFKRGGFKFAPFHDTRDLP